MLYTKLHRPHVTKEHVYRERLIDLLDKNKYKPVTLVSAGAGYGKSMLISSWLERCACPNTWISLNTDDNDLKTFLEYLEAGIKLTLPDAIGNFSRILKAAELPPLKIVAENLINDLDEIAQDFIIVLDDFHLIRDPKVHELLNIFLKYPPQHIHLVIITRRDPLLDLNRIRAHGRMNEIRMSELGFSREEIGQLFKNLIDIDLNSKTIRALHSKTEGWVTGLRLTSWSIKDPENAERVLDNLSGNFHTISNYLIEEVLAQVGDEVRANLLRTSLLNRFCADIIDQVNRGIDGDGDSDKSGQKFIDWLIKSNLFIIPLDNENKWFRFHHLFQALLKSQLQKYQAPDENISLLLCAANWFDKNDFWEEAVTHAIEANDYNLAVAFVSNYRQKLMEKGEIYRLNHLIDLLPLNIIETSPALLAAKSFIMEYRGQMEDMFGFKEKAKDQLADVQIDSQELNAIKGEIATIEGELSLFSGDGKSAFESSKKALELLPDKAIYVQSFALGTQIVSHQLLNNIEDVDEISIGKKIKSNFSLIRVHAWYSIAFAMEGNTQRLKEHAQKLLELSEKDQLQESIIYGKYFLSVALFLSLQDDKAEAYLISIVNDPFSARPYFLANSAFILALIYIQKGKVDEADQLMDLVIQHTEETNNTLVTAIAKAMCVEIELKAGDIEKATLLHSQQETYEFHPPIWYIYVGQLTPVKLKLAINTEESIEDALQMLSEIEGQLRQSNKKTILIDVLILQALALKAKNNEKDALLKLNEALTISSAGNCIRTFVDYGDNLKELLNKSLNTSGYSAHILNILDAITDRKNSNSKITKNRQDKRPEIINTDATSEMLSFREVEILKLVAEGLRNKEIAEMLFISDGTIKKHIYNIGQKLETSSRIGSVRKAEEMELI